MNNIFEKISVTVILLKILGIYFFCYLATNEKIAITHLWHAIEPQTMYHLIAKDKVAEQHILGKHSNCNTVKVGVLRPVQQPGSYWDRSSELPLVGLEPTEVTAYD